MDTVHEKHSLNFWETIARNSYAIPEKESLDQLTEELLSYLYATDPVWRDDIAYQTLTNWIIAGHYTPDQLRTMMTNWRRDLSVNLGEINMPGVITRSFAALMLSIVAYYDWKNAILDESEVHDLVNDALVYLKREDDLRGYDPRFGWIHAVAHTADLLKYLARNPHVDKRGLWHILQGVANKLMLHSDTVFTHSEEERLAWVIIEVIKRDVLPTQVLTMWIDQLAQVRMNDQESDTGHRTDAHRHYAYQNVKQLLRAVYMRLIYSDDLPGGGVIEAHLHEKLRLFLK